jgi:hypothetical protein
MFGERIVETFPEHGLSGEQILERHRAGTPPCALRLGLRLPFVALP